MDQDSFLNISKRWMICFQFYPLINNAAFMHQSAVISTNLESKSKHTRPAGKTAKSPAGLTRLGFSRKLLTDLHSCGGGEACLQLSQHWIHGHTFETGHLSQRYQQAHKVYHMFCYTYLKLLFIKTFYWSV